MNLSQLPKTNSKGKKRLGQGHGSGRVKTSGRGTKGQNARSKVALTFEGGAISLIKRLPFHRGKGRNKVFKKQPVIINISVLNFLKPGSVIDLDALVKAKYVDLAEAKEYGVKILGDGKINHPLTIKLPISKSAAKKIEKAGGKIEV